jgi:hypothetical protein
LTPLPHDLPDPQGPAEAALGEIVPLLPLTDAEQTCLADRVRDDPQLHAALEIDPSKDGPAGRHALFLAQDCIIYHSTTENFVMEAARHSTTPLTEDQRSCLAEEFRKLDRAILAELLNLATDPSGISAETMSQVDGIYPTCGVETSS